MAGCGENYRAGRRPNRRERSRPDGWVTWRGCCSVTKSHGPGTLLVNRLNEQERTKAVIEDVGAVEQEALSQGRYYFGNTYQDAPPAARELLEKLALGGTTRITGATRRWLERRWLIDEHGALRTPVLGTFIRDELSA